MTPQRANVVLSILLVVLVSTLVVAYVRHAKARALTTASLDNLRALGLALHGAHDTHKCLPPAFDRYAEIDYPASLHVHLLPFLKHKELHHSFFVEGQGQAGALVPSFLDPADASVVNNEGVQNYAANLRVFSQKGLDTPWKRDMPPLDVVEPGKTPLFGSFSNGTANILVFATKWAVCGSGGSHYAANPTSPYAAFFGQNLAHVHSHPSDGRATWQSAPQSQECLTSPLMAQSFVAAEIHVAFADASARTLSASLSPYSSSNSRWTARA
jgi:hypothetical protein